MSGLKPSPNSVSANADTAAKDGIDYLKFMERIAEYQLDPTFPDGYALPSSL